MNKLLMTLACTIAFSAPAFAQQVTYACQYIKSAGLNWEKGKWNTSSFNLDKPFFLSTVGGSLTTNSVEKVLTSDSTFCHPTNSKKQTCSDRLGGSLIFNHDNELGGVAQLYGSIDNDANKDTLSVSPFTCTKM